MKRLQWREAVLLLSAPVIVGLSWFSVSVGWSWFDPAGQFANRQRATCMSNMKQLQLAMQMYCLDDDDRFPPVPPATAKASPYGWADLLQSRWSVPTYAPYTILRCPADHNPSTTNPRQSGYTSYWFNSNLYGHKQSELSDPSRTLMFGEGDDGKELCDARYCKTSFPRYWMGNKSTPLYRHRGTGNHIWAAGNIYSFPPEFFQLNESQFKVR